MIGAIALIGGAVEKNRKNKKKKVEKKTEAEVEMEAVDIKHVTYSSFPTLIAVPETAFEQEDVRAAEALGQAHLTVDEFNGILQQLYDNGYVLNPFGRSGSERRKDWKISAGRADASQREKTVGAFSAER